MAIVKLSKSSHAVVTPVAIDAQTRDLSRKIDSRLKGETIFINGAGTQYGSNKVVSLRGLSIYQKINLAYFSKLL